MKQVKVARQLATHSPPTSHERRRIPRTSVTFGLMYSGICENELLMGDGTVVDVSKGGLGIRGNHPVKAGMELTMFLYLPDGADPLFVLEAKVAWSSGNLFGVEFTKLHLREGHRLQSFLRTQLALQMQPVGH